MSSSFRDANTATRVAGDLYLGAGIGLAAARATFTDAQIKQCPVTPLTVAPAPGAGRMLLPVSAVMALDNRGGAYEDCDALEAGISSAGYNRLRTWIYSESAQGAFADDSAVHLLGNFVGPFAGATAPAAWFADSAETVNLPLTVAMFNDAGANPAGTDPLTGGDAANTLTVSVIFAVVTVAS